MDANAAWQLFTQTGRVEDYLRYSQMKSSQELLLQEAMHANQYRCTGHHGENRGRE